MIVSDVFFNKEMNWFIIGGIICLSVCGIMMRKRVCVYVSFEDCVVLICFFLMDCKLFLMIFDSMVDLKIVSVVMVVVVIFSLMLIFGRVKNVKKMINNSGRLWMVLIIVVIMFEMVGIFV